MTRPDENQRRHALLKMLESPPPARFILLISHRPSGLLAHHPLALPGRCDLYAGRRTTWHWPLAQSEVDIQGDSRSARRRSSGGRRRALSLSLMGRLAMYWRTDRPADTMPRSDRARALKAGRAAAAPGRKKNCAAASRLF